MTTPLWAVLPGSIDDPAAPSGGNRYDRAVLALLGTARVVHEVAITGTWPAPDAAARETLAQALTDIPDKSDVLLDGLVACGVPDLLAPHARRLRMVVLVHLPLSDETGLEPAAAAALRARERAALHLASVVIATSRAAARRISDMHDLSGVVVAEPGVDPAEITVPTATGHRLLCVASVTHRKGQDLLVTALERDLADLRWECTFVGALVRPVPHTSADIHFTGPRTGAGLDDAYANADLFVLASRAETYGMVVTEALARGLPVLAADVGGVSEALGLAPDGSRPGLLIPPDDPPALAAALRAWLTDPSLRAALRASALARRTNLPTWTDTARTLSEAVSEGA